MFHIKMIEHSTGPAGYFWNTFTVLLRKNQNSAHFKHQKRFSFQLREQEVWTCMVLII